MAMQRSGRAGRTTLRSDVLIPAAAPVVFNDLGEFRIFGLVPGEYFVSAMMPPFGSDASPAMRHRTMLPTYFPATTDPAAAQPVAAGAGETSGDVVICMNGVPVFQVSGVV